MMRIVWVSGPTPCPGSKEGDATRPNVGREYPCVKLYFATAARDGGEIRVPCLRCRA